MAIQRRPMDVDSAPRVREKMMREEEHVTMVKPEEKQAEAPMKQNILEEKDRIKGWTLDDVNIKQTINDEEQPAETEESEATEEQEPEPIDEPSDKSDEPEETKQAKEPSEEPSEEPTKEPSEEPDADDPAEDDGKSEDKDGDKEQTEEQEYNPWETFKDKGPVEQFMQFQAMSLGALNVEGGPGTKLKSVWDTAAYLSQNRQKKDGEQEDGQKKEDGQGGLEGLKEDTDAPPTPIEDAPKEKLSRRERRRMKKNGDKDNGDKKSAQQRKREEMVQLYEEIRNGNISPTSFKGKRIIRQMRRAGYVGLYRLDYITETDRYVIQFDMIKKRELPQDAHHMTGEPGNYGFDRNGVVFDSARENGFTAISQFNYMHNHKIEDAFNYKWLTKEKGKFNVKQLAVVIIMLVFAGIYVAYTFR